MFESFRAVNAEFPWFFPIVVFIFGACWGSFLNVVIYRVPLKKSVVTPRSFCTTSGKPIPWYDNIPLISWMLLRGKSRFDKQPISLRYPAVELLTALLFLAVWLLQPPLVAISGFVFLALLISGTFIDLEHMILPDFSTVGGLVVGVAFSCFIPAMHGYDDGQPYFIEGMRSGIASVTGALVGSAVILWIAVLAETLLKREAMGFGDVLFMGCIGAFCGWQGAIFAIFGGALVGTVVVIPLMLIQKLFGLKSAGVGRVENRRMEEVAAAEAQGETSAEAKEGDQDLKMGSAIPFGPWLAVGGALYYILLREPVNTYFANLQEMIYLYPF